MAIAIKQLLSQVLDVSQTEWQRYLLMNWRDIVGALHTRMCLEKVHDDTAFIGVYDIHWMHELYLLSSVVIATINKSLGQRHIKKVRFKLAVSRTLPVHTVTQLVHEDAIDTRRSSNVFTPRHEHALAQIPDPQLRESLKEFLYHCAR